MNVVYTRFVNTLTQMPTIVTLLPISAADLPGGKKDDELAAVKAVRRPEERLRLHLRAERERRCSTPSCREYVHFQVYQMILNARASEHSARMVAMKNATDNAKQIIKDLTLEYNKVRQAAITTELLEITTAQMAMG